MTKSLKIISQWHLPLHNIRIRNYTNHLKVKFQLFPNNKILLLLIYIKYKGWIENGLLYS